MNPYDEKRLRDEVIYLHYLWHQGPPQDTNQTPQKRPRPLIQNPTSKKKFAASGSYPPRKPDHGLDWSVLVKPSSPSSPGWPEPKSKPERPICPVSVEDQTRFACMQMQSKVLESCREFFDRKVLDEETADDEEEEEEEKNELDMFFMGIFVNNSELRVYYEENHENGEFFCLVCGGIGENIGKKFKGCVGLVQHCMSISKTKKKAGHRAFGLVVCKVLGWDSDRLPVILLKGEPLSRRLANSIEAQELDVKLNKELYSNCLKWWDTLKGDDSNKKAENLENENSDVEVKKGASNSLKGDDLDVISGNMEFVNGDDIESVKKELSGINQSNGELMVCENCLKWDDANMNVESLEISDAEPNDRAVTDLGFDSSQIRTSEWPCIEPVDESTSTTMEWPSFKPCTASITQAVSAEEQIRFNMVRLQQNVSEACKQFLCATAGSDGDEDDNDFDDDDDDEDEDDNEFDEGGSKESKEFNFFLRLFTENNELRSYYETNHRGGDFCCLVCCGIGKKPWRTFKDCVGLLQHSTAISKTKKRRAHKAFGLVICKVLNWDIDRLPSIMLKSEPQSSSLENLLQHDGNAGCDKDGPDAPKDKTDPESASKEDFNAHENNSLLMSSEHSSDEEPSKDDNLENRTFNIGANEDKPLNSLNSSEENNTQPKANNI